MGVASLGDCVHTFGNQLGFAFDGLPIFDMVEIHAFWTQYYNLAIPHSQNAPRERQD
ncbi:MAG: hypothetical protein BWX88_00989 [Planctomycetes bacterium ADurb.Bin126]|nr:MAG: hypothetical protein BWX88_00989 [Planctomycetes bacterium ADurb.Bin126]